MRATIIHLFTLFASCNSQRLIHLRNLRNDAINQLHNGITALFLSASSDDPKLLKQILFTAGDETKMRYHLSMIHTPEISVILIEDSEINETKNKSNTKPINMENNEESEETVAYEIIGKSRIKYIGNGRLKVAILTILKSMDQVKNYEIAVSTVKCYAKVQGYSYILAVEQDFDCDQQDQFFRNVCIIRKILPSYDVVLLLDADIGVVFPKRRIEEFIPSGFDVVFYRNFLNWEIQTKSFIVRNTPYAKAFLEELSEYSPISPKLKFNDLSHIFYFFLAERFFPVEKQTIVICQKLFRSSPQNFAYRACLQSIFGSRINFDRVKVLRKGSGWLRESWLTNSVWNKEYDDFMFHGWKDHQLRTKSIGNTKIPIYRGSKFEWYNPLAGSICLDKCHPKNMSWSYDERLIGDQDELEEHFDKIKMEIAREELLSFAEMGKLVNDTN